MIAHMSARESWPPTTPAMRRVSPDMYVFLTPIQPGMIVAYGKNTSMITVAKTRIDMIVSANVTRSRSRSSFTRWYVRYMAI